MTGFVVLSAGLVIGGGVMYRRAGALAERNIRWSRRFLFGFQPPPDTLEDSARGVRLGGLIFMLGGSAYPIYVLLSAVLPRR